MMKIRELLIGCLFSVFSLVIFFMLSVPYYSGDVKNHIIWGKSILSDGTLGFYSREFKDYSFPNYPPVSMLSFASSVWFYNLTKSAIISLNSVPIFFSSLVFWIENENVQVSFLKIPSIVPFILSGWIVYFFGKLFNKNSRESLYFSLLFIFNPGLFFVAVVWGQNDFTQILFILGAFYLLLKEKFVLGYLFAGLSILSKQTVLMLWGLFMVATYKLYGLSKGIAALLTSIILIWLAYLPFNNVSLIWPFAFYNETLTKSTGFLVSDNAINFWGVFSGFKHLDAGGKFFLISYEHWGFLVFGLVVLPFILKFLREKFSKELLIYFLYLSSITYFFILTRMHERYLIFGVVFAHLAFMSNKKYWYNLVFFSLLFFLNVYKGLLMPDIPILVDLLNSSAFLSILGIAYFIVIVINSYYFLYKFKNENN